MWPWIILAAVWAAAGYQAWHAYRQARMAEPANPLAAIAARVKVGLGFLWAILMLLAGAIASLTVASAEKNRVASWAAGGTMALAVLGGMGAWKWFWRRRRTAS